MQSQISSHTNPRLPERQPPASSSFPNGRSAIALALVLSLFAHAGHAADPPSLPIELIPWDATGAKRALPRDRLSGPASPSSPFALQLRATPGEVEPASFLMRPDRKLAGVELDWSALRHATTGATIPKQAIEAFWVKCWYQANDRAVYKRKGKRFLVPELLLYDDTLVEVDLDRRLNRLRVFDGDVERRLPVTHPGDRVPSQVVVRQASELLPITLPARENKQVWLRLRLPSSAEAGRYTGELRLRAPGFASRSIPLTVEVLPFSLSPPRLQMAMYYRGQTVTGEAPPRHRAWKSPELLERELADLLDHGIRHPTIHHWTGKRTSRKTLARDLEIRARVGLPKDPLYFIGIYPGAPKSGSELRAMKSRISQWLAFFRERGHSQIYLYGKDEAKGRELTDQRTAWRAVHDLGAKMFVAGNTELSTKVADVLDLAVIANDFDPVAVDEIKRRGNRVFSYANPQVGLEDPDRYRRSHGFELWKAGYDGTMTYAYNDIADEMWNDFDGDKNRRDFMFTYPIEDALIGTVQWEGLREGIDDLRYLATLEDLVDGLPDGESKRGLRRFIAEIDASKPPRSIRSRIIDKIRELVPEARVATRQAND